MLMNFLLIISMQSIGTPSQTTITVSNNIPDSIQDTSKRIDFVVSDNISNNNTSPNDNDAWSNMTSMDIDDILT